MCVAENSLSYSLESASDIARLYFYLGYLDGQVTVRSTLSAVTQPPYRLTARAQDVDGRTTK